MKISRKLALGATLACAAWASTATAATEQQKLDAIIAGLDNLVATQTAGGYWNYGGYEPAATGAALQALMSRKDKYWAYGNPAGYQAAADKAAAYLLGVATLTTVSTRNDGVNICPGGSGNCNGIYWNAANNEDSYTTGLVASGLDTYALVDNKANVVATTTGTLAGLKWSEIAQGITNLWAASQSTANQGNRIGGWRYVLGAGGYDSDMSTTQWGIISLIYNQSLGATTPAIVKTDLAKWLAFAQDPFSGAGCYQGPGSYCDHANTGGMLLGLNFVGKPNTDPAVQNALAFLNTNWTQTANNTWYGNFGHPYAMWGVYKGLEVNIGLKNGQPGFLPAIITNLRPGTCGAPNLPGIPPDAANCNWWEDYNESLVQSQNANGSWSGYSNWTGVLATAFNVSILQAAVIPPQRCDATLPSPQIDKLDLALISKSRGQVPTQNDPRDANGDGKIDPADVKVCIPLCTFANCAVSSPIQPLP